MSAARDGASTVAPVIAVVVIAVFVISMFRARRDFEATAQARVEADLLVERAEKLGRDLAIEMKLTETTAQEMETRT